jgi:hypothetical protein
MARQTLGDFHINLQLPLGHIQQSQFQQGVVQEIIQQFGPTQIVLFKPPGEIVCPSGVYWQSSNLSGSFGTSLISLTLSLYMGCNAHSVVICKGIESKQHTPLMRQFQGNHVSTNECVQHGLNVAGPRWDGTSTGSQSRD